VFTWISTPSARSLQWLGELAKLPVRAIFLSVPHDFLREKRSAAILLILAPFGHNHPFL